MTVLGIPGCPHSSPAAALVRAALDDLGRQGTSVVTREVTDEADARRLGFAGSPSFFANGADLFGSPGLAPAFSCRLYSTPNGLAGVPTIDDLKAVLSRLS